LPIDIQPYVEAYQSQVAALLDDFQDYFLPMDPLGRLTRPDGYGEEYLRRMLEEHSEHNGTMLLALSNEHVVGFGAAIVQSRLEDDWFGSTPAIMGRITELFVTVPHRDQGVGTALMAKLEAELKSRGCEYVWVEVFSPNAAAHRFYERLGYGDRDVQMIKKV
jgi:ribosomal protein S18 acetylase RimI-like enzyme